VDGGAAGSFGQTGVFAFYPNKQVTTGEGGVIVTDDSEIAGLCRSWRNQGRGEGGSWLQHERLGYNYRLSDINCALGAVQLARLPEMLRRRAQVAAWYTERLSLVPEVIPPAPTGPGVEMSWFVYVVRLRDEFTRQDRDHVLQELRALGIACNDYFTPIHLQPFYREQFGFEPYDFPITEGISERTIALPFFNNLPQGDVDYVCESLQRVVRTLTPQPALGLRVETAAADRR
jgi:perosamine synthetase